MSNPYDDLLEQDASQLRAQQAATLTTAVDVKPDAFAAQRNVAKYLGYPAAAVAATPEASQREFTTKKVMDDASGYPELQRRYATDEFARLAHDDSPTLAGIGGQIAKAAKYAVGANTDGNTLGGDVIGGYHQAAAGTAGVFRAGAEFAASAAEMMVPGLRASEQLGIAGGNPLRRLGEGFGMLAADSDARAKASTPEAKGIVSSGVSSGVQSTVGNLLMLPLALLPGGEAAALYGMSAQQGGQSYQKAREAGLDQHTALVYGVSDAAIEYATEKLPLHVLVDSLKKGKSFVKTAGAELVPEVIGEQVATALQDMNEWAVMPANKDKTFKDYLADRPAAAAQTLIATLVGVGGQVGVMHAIQTAANNASGKQREIDQANAGAEHLKQMFSLAAASKLRERAPDTFADYVNATSANTDGAPTHVYVDARTLAGEGGLLKQDKVAELLPSVAPQLAEAIATGGDVQIPVGELLANVTGTPLEQQLVEHLRTTPDSLSLAESKEASKQAEEYLQSQVERVMGQTTDVNALAASAENVKTTVLDQLKSANRFTPDVHDAYASLVRDFYTVTSQRLGVSPEALYARYPLRVAAVNPAGEGVALTQDGKSDGTVGPDGRPRFFTNAGQQASGPNLRGAGPAEDFATATRIKSRGAPARLYRGAGQPLVPEHFGLDALGKSSGHPTSGLGVWFTPDRAEAARYGNVEEFHLDLRNPKHIKAEDIPSFNSVAEAHAFARELEKQGHDGIVFDAKHLGGERHAVAFHPEQVIHTAGGAFNQSVSTRVPTAKKATENPLSEMLVVGLPASMADPKAFEKNVELVTGYPNYKPVASAKTTEQKAEHFIAHVVDNLLWLHDQMPADIRDRAHLWYDGARNLADRWSRRFGVTDTQASGVFAVLSPQKDWFMNVSLGERVLETMREHQDTAWSPAMSDVAARILAKPEYHDDRAAITGKTLGELPTAALKAMWIRVYDEAHNTRNYRIITPEGGIGEWVTNDNGSRSKVAWGDFGAIAKAVRIVEDGSIKTISEQLGEQHKVRNFYNNIFDPNDAHGSVTIDTHAVAAGLLRPLSGSANEVLQNFAGAGAASSSVFGSRGTYGIYAEAYRRAAAARGVLPREMQSITWEAVRGLFTPGFKSQAKNVDAVNALWENYRAGNATLDATRNAILQLAGGINAPEWVGSPPGAHEGSGDSSYARELAQPGVPGGSAGPAAGRAAATGSARAAESSGLDTFAGESPAYFQGRDLPAALSSGQPLQGLPTTVKVDGREVTFGPFEPAREAAAQYMASTGIEYTPATDYAKVDPERGARIAAAFEAMKHDPSNPVVKAAYDAMIEETLAQYETILATGLKVEFIEGKDPYGNPRNAILDVVNNNHLYVYSTRDGFGSSEFDPKDNPLLAGTKYEDVNGKPMLANDVFRVVHDYFGHVKEGVGFRADGEENAWRAHAAMYSPLARRAMTTETRGQNSWVNFGPHAEKNKTASGAETAYADQKIGLLPDWVSSSGLDLPAAVSTGKGGTLVNIGLDIPGGGHLDVDEALRALRAAGVMVRRTAVHQSDTEQTLVAELSHPMDVDTAHAISVALKQESVAQLAGDAGALHGPQKDKWGAFNPDYFLMLDGSRASTPTPALHQGPRGTFSPSSLQISLLEGADLSTFLHETGHFFLEVTADLASQPGAPAQLADDMNALLKWFGVKDLATWNAMSLEEKRPHHEKFAESFEQYLFEGKAPGHELQPLFARFRAWLTNVYGSITKFLASHDTQLTDEVRQVFNRMLAAEDAIRAAEAAREYAPVFESAEQAGMDPIAWLAYQEQGKAASDAAVEQLEKRSLRDMRWASNARAKALKALQRDAASKRKAVTAEVTAEVDAMPVYAVQKFVSQPENARLPDELTAEMFGFSSADEMKTKVTAAQPRDVMIEGMTDQRLLERYGDLTSTQGMARAADEAVHNEARAKFVATELNALMKAAQPVLVTLRAAKEFAAGLVARRKVRDLKPGQHLQAETRAARAAVKAMSAGDTKGAIVAKRDQLLNNQAARETQAAIAEVEKRVKWLRAFAENTTLPAEYLDQIHSLLERFDLKTTSNKELDKRKSLVEWVESQRAVGIDPELPPGLLDGAQRTNYRDMTVEQFRGLVDAVKQIEHLGRLKSKLLTAKDQREFDAIKQDLVDSITANAKGRKADTRTPTTNLGRALQAVKNFGAAHIKAATWARVLDGGKDGGPVWERFVRPANERGDMETTMRAKATRELSDIIAPLLKSGKMGGRGKFFPTINRSLNRESVLALALNTGNEGNLQRLLGGESWTLEQIQPVLDTLTGEEWAAVQKIWDHFDSYRPLIGEKEKRVYGKEPDWIKPAPREQVLPSGQTITVKGGYYPIKYDPAASVRAEEHADAEGAKRMLQGAYSAATTRRSFTKSRAEEVTGRPLLYTLAGLYSGVNDVIHDLAWHEWLIDVNRMLRSQSIDGAIRTSYGPAAVHQFKSWRDAVAEGDHQTNAALDMALGRLRQGVSTAGLGFNVLSALIQPLGITQSIVRVGPKWVGKGIAQYIANPVKATRDVHERSDFMHSRAQTLFRELNEVRNKVQGKANTSRGAYFLMQQFQQMVDVPTWLGAYEKAIAEGNDEERAVALADQAVIDSQGSGLTKDLSAIERGGPAQKMFTVFYSFMNTASNLQFNSKMTAESKAKKAADVLLLLVVPAILGKLLKNALTPGDSGDDDSWKKLARVLIGEQLTYLMGLMVITREFGEAAKGLAGLEDHPRDYQGPAGARVAADTAALAKQAHQGEFDDHFRKALVNVLGSTLGLPSAQINRTITGAKALKEGKTKNPAALVMGYQEPHP